MREHEFRVGLYREARVNKHISRTRLTRAVLACALLVPLLLWISGCWLFNVPPIAAFTINSQAGQVPFAVNFSAVLSEDEDGIILQFEWDFGDGTSGSGESVTHTYTTAGTFTVVLRVTDNDGETGRTNKTIYVSPAEPPGPAASFTTSSTSGTAPLAVTFDASPSSYDAGVISYYRWNWGDGSTGYTKMGSHLYLSSGTYTVTLTVYATDGKTGTATKTISVTTAGGTTPTSGAPSAGFDIITNGSVGVAPFLARFDPSDSEADEGRTIILYTWSFGDGAATSDVSATVKEHVFTTDTTSETFSVTLLVLDNEGASDSITKTVKVYNHRPVAGFEIGNPKGGDGAAQPVQYVDPDKPILNYIPGGADDIHLGEWCPDDVVYGNLGTLQTASVVIRSREFDADAPAWFALTDAVQKDLVLADGTSATSTSTPDEPATYDDHNYSYDAEGQEWTAATFPDWFTNQSWGVRYLYINWGDNTGTEQVNFEGDVDTVVYHIYDCSVDGKVFEITVTAEDYLGYRSAPFSRYVTVKKGVEGGGDL